MAKLRPATFPGFVPLAIFGLLLSAVSASGQIDTHRQTLDNLGIPPTSAGAVKYLQDLHPTPGRKAQVAALIEQLSSTSFAERESAMKALLRMPGLPIAQLSAAAESNDPEVRWRARGALEAVGRTKQPGDIRSTKGHRGGGHGTSRPPGRYRPCWQSSRFVRNRTCGRRPTKPCKRLPGGKTFARCARALADGNSQQRAAAVTVLCAVVHESERATLAPAAK